jgi:membrane-associated phospholipid phosphatase
MKACWALTEGRSISRMKSAGALLLLLCLVLGLLAVQGLTLAADIPVLRALALRQSGETDGLISVFAWITWSGNEAQRTWLAVAAALLLLWLRRPRAALVMIIVPVLTGVTTSLLKQLYARPRPDLVPHLDAVSNLSYPSGHASNAMAVWLLAAMLIGQSQRRTWVASAVAIAFTIGLSRLFLGVHYPTDLIGGWLWGAGFAIIGAAMAKRLEAR